MKCFEFSEREVKLLIQELDKIAGLSNAPLLHEFYKELKE